MSTFMEKLKSIVNPVTQKPFNEDEESLDINPLSEETDVVTEVYPIKETDVVEKPEYEYEVLIQDTRIFELGTWLPVATSRIKRPENIKKYIQHGILRKINR